MSELRSALASPSVIIGSKFRERPSVPATESNASEPKKLPGIFISYRRTDNPDATGRIYDRLVAEFGKARVFKDVDSIPLGQDFRSHLNGIVGDCAAVLAIIGPKWTDTRNVRGTRRLEDPDDFVRIELEAALARDIPVVPVLVGHAPMPGTSDLPTSLASMAFRQSIDVRPDPDFHNDATRLVSALWAIVDPNRPRMASRSGPVRSWTPWLGAIATVTTVAAIAFAIPAVKHLREDPLQETRIAVSLPVAGGDSFALSPDGRQIVYLAKGDAERRLWLRSLATTTAQPLPGTGGAQHPLWSPDGRSIAFFAGGALKRLDLGGGQPQTLATANDAESLAIWGKGGDILFNPGATSALMRMSASGGPLTQVTKLYANNTGHRVHAFLPDGKHFLFASIRGGEERGIYLGSLDGSPAVHLTTDLGPGGYLPSGWILIQRFNRSGQPTGEVVAYRLDVGNARVGEPVTVATGVGAMSASATGLLAFSTAQVASQRQLTWVDRSGAELGTIGDADATLDYPRVAPDGRRVLVSRVREDNRDIWLLDGERASRMTIDAEQDSWPLWSPDGQRIIFSSSRTRTLSLYVKSAGAAGGDEPLETNEQVAFPTAWTEDGEYLMYTAASGDNNSAIRVRQMTGEHKSADFLNTPFIEAWGQFSPDGHWVAYMSNEAGRFEVFVRAFPAHGDAAQKMVSTAGGVYPMWRPDGREIYYINPAGEMMATPVSVSGSVLVPGTPVKLFNARAVGGGIANRTGRQYDVARDGRFLINREPDVDAVPTITLIQNWNPDADK
jgi:Tol biopolymer transport system component